MDGLSAVASVIAVIQIASVISSHCMDYIRSARNTKSLILKLVQELGGLQIVLRTLEQLTQRKGINDIGEDDSDEKSYLLPTLHKLCQLEYVFEECLRKLEKLEKDIEPSRQVNLSKKESFFRALHWPLKEAYMNSIMDDINHYISLFSLALTLDETDNVLEIREKTYEIHSMVNILHSQKEEESRRLHGEKIVKWLSAPDSSVDYTHALRMKTKSTGTWFIEDEAYKNWKQRSGSLFWIYGIAGCGKTILSSTIVEDLLSSNELDMSVAVAYYYFKADDKDKMTSSNMVRSLLKQLFDRGKRTSNVFTNLLGDETRQPSLDQLLSSLNEISLEFCDVYIVLDALDECQDLQGLFDILEDIDKWTENSVHLIFTSRETKDIKEFVDCLTMNKSLIRLSASVVKQDIRMYIQDRLRTDRNFKRWRGHPEVQQEIEDSLVEKSEGMFQWVMYQLLSLVDCRKPQELRQILKTMPKGLNDTYAQILSQISDKDYDIAMRILYWLLFGYRPLYIEELAELAAMDLNAKPFNGIERLWDPSDVLNICPNLLTTVEEHKKGDEEPRLLVRLAHISIQEYLLSSDILKGKASRFHIKRLDAHASITECCLMYMRLMEDTVLKAAESLPLAVYAAYNWLNHYRNLPETYTQTHSLVLDFFVYQKDTYTKWITYFSSTSVPQFAPTLMGPTPLLPLEVVSTYSLLTVLKMMFECDDIDTKSGYVLKKALRAAHLDLFSGTKTDTARLLLQHGAGSSGDGEFANTLNVASYFGFDDMVKGELDSGVDVNQLPDKITIALQEAASGRYAHDSKQWDRRQPSDPTTIRLLLDRGANPNFGNMSPLLSACYAGDLTCVKLLLAHGADPNYIQEYEGTKYTRSCLVGACRSGDIRIVRLLFEHGCQSISSGAMKAAAQGGYLDIMRLLFEKGVDLKWEEEEEGETSLQKASAIYRPDVVELLLQHGADVKVGGGYFEFPLLAACIAYGSIETIKLLISYGADVNQRGSRFGTPLHAATFFGDVEMVEYLIAQGADIHAEGVVFRSLMRHAIQNSHTKIFIVLFKKGLDMDTPGGRYGETLRETLAAVPADKSEIWLRTHYSSKYPTSLSLCAMVRKGDSWQDIDNIILEESVIEGVVDSSKLDCLLPNDDWK